MISRHGLWQRCVRDFQAAAGQAKADTKVAIFVDLDNARQHGSRLNAQDDGTTLMPCLSLFSMLGELQSFICFGNGHTFKKLRRRREVAASLETSLLCRTVSVCSPKCVLAEDVDGALMDSALQWLRKLPARPPGRPDKYRGAAKALPNPGQTEPQGRRTPDMLRAILVLVSADGDFAPLLCEARAAGVVTVSITTRGEKQTALLAEHADLVLTNSFVTNEERLLSGALSGTTAAGDLVLSNLRAAAGMASDALKGRVHNVAGIAPAKERKHKPPKAPRVERPLLDAHDETVVVSEKAFRYTLGVDCRRKRVNASLLDRDYGWHFMSVSSNEADVWQSARRDLGIFVEPSDSPHGAYTAVPMLVAVGIVLARRVIQAGLCGPVLLDQPYKSPSEFTKSAMDAVFTGFVLGYPEAVARMCRRHDCVCKHGATHHSGCLMRPRAAEAVSNGRDASGAAWVEFGATTAITTDRHTRTSRRSNLKPNTHFAPQKGRRRAKSGDRDVPVYR